MNQIEKKLDSIKNYQKRKLKEWEKKKDEEDHNIKHFIENEYDINNESSKIY